MIHKLLDKASNPEEEDIDRIDAMRDVLLEDEKERIISLAEIQKVLIDIVANQADDYLVRQHAAHELSHYPLSGINKDIEHVLFDIKDDLDVRINLSSSIEHLPREVLEQVFDRIPTNDPLKLYLKVT